MRTIASRLTRRPVPPHLRRIAAAGLAATVLATAATAVTATRTDPRSTTSATAAVHVAVPAGETVGYASDRLLERRTLPVSRSSDRLGSVAEQRLHVLRRDTEIQAEQTGRSKILLPAPPTPAPRATRLPAGAPADLSGNRALGYRLMIEFGFGADQWPALEALWTRESGWNQYADNPTSSAYGIPQALPGTKMSSAGSDWATNPATQIRWGLGYIKDRYGDPNSAWAHSQSTGWY